MLLSIDNGNMVMVVILNQLISNGIVIYGNDSGRWVDMHNAHSKS